MSLCFCGHVQLFNIHTHGAVGPVGSGVVLESSTRSFVQLPVCFDRSAYASHRSHSSLSSWSLSSADPKPAVPNFGFKVRPLGRLSSLRHAIKVRSHSSPAYCLAKPTSSATGLHIMLRWGVVDDFIVADILTDIRQRLVSHLLTLGEPGLRSFGCELGGGGGPMQLLIALTCLLPPWCPCCD